MDMKQIIELLKKKVKIKMKWYPIPKESFKDENWRNYAVFSTNEILGLLRELNQKLSDKNG